MRYLWTLVALFALGSDCAIAAPPGTVAPPNFSGADLATDLAVLEDALKTLHPGIYRYTTPAAFDARFEVSKRRLARGATLPEAFLDITQLVASLRCGHTWTNPLNQPPRVSQAILAKADRLPLHFTVVGRRFLVDAVLPDAGVLVNDEIVSIDGVSADSVIAKLWPYLRADGNSDGKRIAQIGHDAGQSAFDIYYSLLSPPHHGERTLELRKEARGRLRRVKVRLVTEADREAALGGANASTWTYRTEHDLAIIEMPTWAFWNEPFDYRRWLDTTFADLRSRGTRALVIDLRRNEGGDGAIGDELLRRIVPAKVTSENDAPHLVYDVVPDRLRPWLSTWDKSFYDQRARVQPASDGGFTLKDRGAAVTTIEPSNDGFRGSVFILTGPTMSSATFEFARLAQLSHAATLVGQPTGGNRRGINGGQMFFLQLPKSGISVDIPVIAWNPSHPEPDAPVLPDIPVAPDIRARAAGKDSDLDAVRARLSAQAHRWNP